MLRTCARMYIHKRQTIKVTYHFCSCTVGKTPVTTNVVTQEENNHEEKPSPQPSDQDPASSSDITQKTNEPDINLKTQPSPWNTWRNNTQEEALIMGPKTAIKQYGTHLSSDNRKAEWHYRLCERNAIRLPVFKVHTSVIPQSTHLQCQLQFILKCFKGHKFRDSPPI